MNGITRLPHPNSKAHSLYFLKACGRSKEHLSIPGVTQRNLELPQPRHSLD